MLLSSHRLLKVLETLAFIAVLIAFIRPRLGSSFFARMESDFRDLARNRRKAILAAALFPMIARALMLPWYPPPPPQIHDEFSYLLQADTFAHGRIANPTPPYWQHFESEYILLKPVYASQYQPAQGLVLAFGQVVFRHAWFGVWISIGVMCAALCWALGYVLPPVWALFGAFAAALQFGIFGLWMNSYFGGAVAATAGALALGSLVRMKRGIARRSSAALCAFAIILLFSTRPFEALLWSAVALVYVVFTARTALFTQIVAPFLLVFLAGAGALAYYNYRITGSPANPPYLEYQRVYGTPQPYWWQPPVRIASFDFPELRDNYLNQLHLYENRYSPAAIFDAERERLRNFWRFFVGPFFTPALAFIGFVFRDRRIRPWLYASVPFILDKATYHAWFPAQSAPATILIVLVIVQCWRHMVVWWRRREVGVAMSRQLVTACCLTLMLGATGRAVEPILPDQLRHLPPIWESLYPARRLRDDITSWLERIPGKHLVFVRYSPDHCFCEEWVFNGADIRNQRVVYARPYTPASDEALARYLDDHDVWMIEPDEHPYKLARLDDSQLAKLALSESGGE
ncbi:MAG TPA: hypothetical protein VHB50_12380 [Bryobacteraceae bacterium]|nr:hypothetical protein [Bryobacteraceae bacterium]